MNEKSIFILTGEPSGDLLGAKLMRELQRQGADLGLSLRFHGVGGERMLAEGLQSLFPQRDLALFGLFELLPKLHLILRRLRETVTAIKQQRPDLVITIDSPDFVFRVSKRLQGSGIPIIHYVAPSVWAWRPGRAKKIAAFLTHLLTLFPFEPPYFTREGLPATFVGHPLVENNISGYDGAVFRQRHSIPIETPLLIVLPGSRNSEVRQLLPIFRDAIAQLAVATPTLKIVIPTVPHVAATVREAVADWPSQPLVVEGDTEKYEAFKAGQAALCASGTVTLECALAELPMVVAYRISAVTAFLYRRFIKTKYVSLVNVLLQREVVPELLQEACTPEQMVAALQPLLINSGARAQQQADLCLIPPLVQNGARSPSEIAAETVLTYLK